MDPKVIIPVDHSVALDVREGDYYGINVKYAKKAGEVEHLPELQPTQSDDDVVAFTIGEESYSKRINNVQNANVALYDKKGRDLSKLASEETYTALVDNYIAGKQLVLSVNGMTGNITLPIAELKTAIVTLQEAIDSESDALGAETERLDNDINAIKNDVEAFSDSLSTTMLDVDNMKDTILEHSNSISNAEVAIDDIKNEQITQNESIATNTNDITHLKENCTNLGAGILALNKTVSAHDAKIIALEQATEGVVSESTIDAKIAEAMTAEQVQDDALKARMDSLESQIEHYDDTELRNRIESLETENAQLKTKMTTVESAMSAATERIAALESLIAAIDLSVYLKKEDADALYKGKAECNAQLADLQEQITNNIGRVLTEDPNENNRVWVEQ